jgi:hypothetical protein
MWTAIWNYWNVYNNRFIVLSFHFIVARLIAVVWHGIKCMGDLQVHEVLRPFLRIRSIGAKREIFWLVPENVGRKRHFQEPIRKFLFLPLLIGFLKKMRSTSCTWRSPMHFIPCQVTVILKVIIFISSMIHSEHADTLTVYMTIFSNCKINDYLDRTIKIKTLGQAYKWWCLLLY